jgi:copper homeostasis protein
MYFSSSHPDLIEALEMVIASGFTRILTSGGKPNAYAGLSKLKQMAEVAGNRIAIMPGGGVRAENIAAIKEHVGVMEYHSSALNTHTNLPDELEIRNMKSLLLR